MLRQSRYITAAALEEAAREGAPELDTEHLLLGLLVTGGPSAVLLTDAGVDLNSLRRAVHEVRGQELARLGWDMTTREVTSTPEPSFRAAQSIPFNSRAMAVMQRISYSGDDLELLRALLDDEGRRVDHALAHLGVDVEDLRAATSSERLGQTTESDDEASTADQQDDSNVVRHVQALPVDADRVWRLVSDPTRRPQWDTACSRSDVDTHDVERLTYRTRGREVVVEQVVDRLVPGYEVRWHRFRVGDRATSSTLGLRLEPVGRTCRLHLEVTWRPVRTNTVPRFLRPLVGPLWVRANRSRLRWYAQNIARAAARTGDLG